MKVETMFLRQRDSLTLDVDILKDDYFTNEDRKLKLLEILFNLLYIYGHVYARESSSGKGIHIVVNAKNSEEIRLMYDDNKRVELDKVRAGLGNMHGFLWYLKGNKKAGQWIKLENSEDVIRFVEDFFRWSL